MILSPKLNTSVLKDILPKQRKEFTEWENVFGSYASGKGLVSRIYKKKFLKEKYPIKKTFCCPGWCGSADKCQPANQIVVGSIPSEGTDLGCVPGPQ